MAKITLENGTVLEGSVEELRQMGVKFADDVKPLEVGDYAKVTQAFHRQNGTIVKLKAYERPGSEFPFRSVNLDGSEGDIFDHSGLTRATDEEVAEAKKHAQPETITHEGVEYKRVDREAREGDVVVVRETGDCDLTVGKAYVVIERMRSTDAGVIDDVGDNNVVGPDSEEFDVYEPIVAKPAPLQVGDYAKVVKVADPMCGFNVGDIGEILDTKTHGIHPIAIKSENGIVGYGSEGVHLVRATDEEVAEAKQAKRWAEIGRKPNEFKKGDIVLVIDSYGSSQRDGNIGEITQVDNDSTPYRVNSSGITYGNFLLGSQLELITPVEHRFDKPAGDSE